MDMMQKDERFMAIEKKIVNWVHQNYPHGYSVDAEEDLDSATINEMLKAKHPNDAFRNMVIDSYLDYESDIYSEIWNELQSDLALDSDEESYMDDMYDECMDVIKENLCINLPFDDYKGQMVCCNLVIDNKDATSDFSYHDCYPAYDAESIHQNLSRNSGMMLMAHLEGYSTKKFRKVYNQYKKAFIREKQNQRKMKALEKKYPFVTSCYNEIGSCTSSMGAFVICFKMTLGDLMNWTEEKTDIHVSKGTSAGLCDFWNGTGGDMEIVLEKDTVIPKENIFALLPDDAWNHTKDGVYTGYSISEIYGMCEHFWDVA